MRQLKSFLKFARPQIIVTCVALVILGSLLSGTFNIKILLALVLVTFAIVHANSINDYSDRQIDEINLRHAKDRPLVTGDLSDKEFWLFHYGSAVATLILSIFFGVPAIILTITLIISDYIYSLKPIRLTDRTLISPLVLAFWYTYYPLSLGFWSANRQNAYPWMLSIGIFLAFVARMLLKDFRDIKGDKKFGKKTFLIRYGAKATCVASAVLWFSAFSVTIYAMNFNIGVLLPLPFGLFQVCLLLDALWRTSDRDIQQKIIYFVANAANFSIVALFISVLVRQQSSLSSLERALFPVVIGGLLLIFNFVRYLSQRPLLLKQPQKA
jgi:4-hydroxybenzoate polyprenyltransferase